MNYRAQRIPPVFEPDMRPGADAFVYCKGCGSQLEGQPRFRQARTPVTVMMCEPCTERHGHQLIPSPGSPSFCYRCGGPDEIFIEKGISPVTHHVCPRCIPDRSLRYRTGNFNQILATPPESPAAKN